MTPKEKAEELYVKYIRTCKISEYYPLYMSDHEISKQCALIAVDEIIKSEPSQKSMIMGGVQLRYLAIDYWQEVKQEIEKL